MIAALRDPSLNLHRTIRRFSNLAAAGLALVTLTGVARAIHEVGGWQELNSSYGALVIAKVALLIAIAALGAANRWRHVPAAATDTRPLRRTARVEIALAVLATRRRIARDAAAARGREYAAGIEVSGADFATTVKATLSAVSNEPGPNRFSVALEDYDSGESISPDRVSLRFTPIDDVDCRHDAGVVKEYRRVFTGTEDNVAFNGRWRVNVSIERGPVRWMCHWSSKLRADRRRFEGSVQESRPFTDRDRHDLVVHFTIDQQQRGERRLQISCFNSVTKHAAFATWSLPPKTTQFLAATTVTQKITMNSLHRSASKIRPLCHRPNRQRRPRPCDVGAENTLNGG